MYKMTFGRKFLALMLGTVLMWGAFFVSLFVETGKQVLGTQTLGILVGAQILLCMMYVGGNVWSSFIKSKYFHPELLSPPRD